jgi:hypothetical protein
VTVPRARVAVAPLVVAVAVPAVAVVARATLSAAVARAVAARPASRAVVPATGATILTSRSCTFLSYDRYISRSAC